MLLRKSARDGFAMNTDHGRRQTKLLSSCRSLFAGLLLTCVAAPMAMAQPGPQLPSAPTIFAMPAAITAPVESIGNVIAKNRMGEPAAAGDYTSYPVINASSAPPLVMMVMSRDEQLFIKAYPDYTDLDGDGLVDTTYNDHFDYSGYFDSGLCYTYASSQFKASGVATGASAANGEKNHQCSGAWSGNFLNWVAMSRLDVVRLVLSGGYRSTDTSTRTVLERANIPNDLHAWAKVYTGSDVNRYTPFSQDSKKPGISFCNATMASGNAVPQMRVARGNWSEWASTALRQCDWKETLGSATADNSYNDDPSKNNEGLGDKEFTVRVEVCDRDSKFNESFCQRYSYNGSESYKPVGLLQRYGENGQMRFGLLTGSFSAPRSGGVLRRNIGRIAGNGDNPVPTACAPGDEVKLSDGTFCNQGDGAEGIINTLNRLKLTQWNYSSNWNDCSTYSILNRGSGSGSSGNRLNNPGASGSGSYACSAWGNPLSEMYAEALRYIAADGNPTAAFKKTGDVAGMPVADWKDPYGANANPYCSACSVIILSTGLNSFDSDEIPNWSKAGIGMNAAAATKEIGDKEHINGNSYLIGRVLTNQSDLNVGKAVNTYEDLCEARGVADLSLARGLCPDIPSMEGSYLISGLAYQAWTKDMRPDLRAPNGDPRPAGYKNSVQTYAIALAENLPKFQIPLGNAGSITLSPLCQANNTGTAGLNSNGWRSCYLGAVGVGTKTSSRNSSYIYGRPLQADGKAGSFSLVWEDSLWGNDHDNDVVSMLTYCVGSTCNTVSRLPGAGQNDYDICWRSDSSVCSNKQPSVADDEVLIRIENLSAYAGNAMASGYTITGSNNDGVKKLLLRPGNVNGSLLTSTETIPNGWTKPQVVKYTVGTSSAKQLENPLFYAAKYGGFTKTIDSNGNPIEQPCDSTTTPACAVSNWDQVNNETGDPGSDGLPDTFFPVRNPAQLGERLAAVFNGILTRSGSGTSAAVVSSSAAGEGLTYQALYQARTQNTTGSQVADWTGALNALWTDAEGRLREGGYAPGGIPTLGDYADNPIVMFCTTTEGDSRFQTYTQVEDVPERPIEPAACTGQSLDQLRTVWSAQTLLSQGTYQTVDQRSYGTPATAANGRHIFTWVDADHDGEVDDGEQRDFAWGDSGLFGAGTCGGGSTATGNFRFLNTCDAAGARALVDWVRGTDYTGDDGQLSPAWRSRTVDDKVYRLGDIVNSTPLAVGTPAEAFDLLYNDSSYGTFRRVYQQRRQMVYVGANDGMLHAFNGGFYDAANKQLNLQPSVCSDSGCSLDGNFTQHPLGAEVWSYVPGNLLPHLRWLADPDYVHMFYVDGSPISQDVRIFADASEECSASGTTQCHPDGWGTILIVPFRFGGGPITLDTEMGTTVTQQSSFPAYVVLDVTNPEAEPVVLAELTNTDGSNCNNQVVSCADLTKVLSTYTSSLPAVAMFRPSGQQNPEPSKFVLFTGSGSTDNGGIGTVEGGEAISTQGARIRAYDLSDTASKAITPMTWSGGKPFIDLSSLGSVGVAAGSFTGDLIASDFDLDGVAESLYFGTTMGSAPPFGGALWAIDFNFEGEVDSEVWLARQVLSGMGKPVTIRPTLGLNNNQDRMVFFGTGRVYTKNDLSDKSRQVIGGVIDDGVTTVAYDSLLDVTEVDVDTEGGVSGGQSGAAESISELAEVAESASGWKFELEVAQGEDGSSQPAERVIATQVLAGGALVTTSYTPGTDQCTDQGEGRMYAMNYRTGTGDPSLADLLGTRGGDSNVLNKFVELGKGLPSQPSLHKGGTGADGSKKLRACVQTSSGAIICQDLLPLQGINSGEISWREPLTK